MKIKSGFFMLLLLVITTFAEAAPNSIDPVRSKKEVAAMTPCRKRSQGERHYQKSGRDQGHGQIQAQQNGKERIEKGITLPEQRSKGLWQRWHLSFRRSHSGDHSFADPDSLNIARTPATLRWFCLN